MHSIRVFKKEIVFVKSRISFISRKELLLINSQIVWILFYEI